MSFVFYRFVRSVNDLKPGGQIITDPLEVDFWRKRFIYMEWISRMDDLQLELILIGCNPVARPFYNDYTKEGLAKIRAFNHYWAVKFSKTPSRPLLAEENWDSLTELEEYTKYHDPKANA